MLYLMYSVYCIWTKLFMELKMKISCQFKFLDNISHWNLAKAYPDSTKHPLHAAILVQCKVILN